MSQDQKKQRAAAAALGVRVEMVQSGEVRGGVVGLVHGTGRGPRVGEDGRTLAAVNWTEGDLRSLKPLEQAKKAGELLGQRAKAAGMVGLKGYRDIGGIRVSMYNAVTVANIETLVSFMEEFVKKNG